MYSLSETITTADPLQHGHGISHSLNNALAQSARKMPMRAQLATNSLYTTLQSAKSLYCCALEKKVWLSAGYINHIVLFPVLFRFP